MKTSFDVQEPPALKRSAVTVEMERIEGTITKLMSHLSAQAISAPHKRCFWEVIRNSLLAGAPSRIGKRSQSCSATKHAKKRRLKWESRLAERESEML